MESLKQDFLKRSVAALEDLTERAKGETVLPPEFLRETFRTLHTIKGTSQTFGFSVSAKITHELETLLSNANEDNGLTENFKSKLLKGFARLINSFSESEKFPERKPIFEKTERSKVIPSAFASAFAFEPEITKQFSEQEKRLIDSEVKNKKNIFVVDADFRLTDFAVKFKDLSAKLSEKGEIIATFPNPKPAEKGFIGFQICFASEESADKLRENTKDYSLGITQHIPLITNSLDEILIHLTAYGKELAAKIGKDIEIKTSTEKTEVSAEKSNLIFEVLIQLLRNAIDHAIEPEEKRIAKGKNRLAEIEISIKRAPGGIKFFVKDDGKGIDAEGIRARAIEKSLISADKTLTESEMIDLIFLHEFSTAENITEISGRGVGLDAVKKIIENANGTISVKSRRDSGTTFEVFLQL